MRGDIFLSPKEADRSYIMNLVIQNRMTVRQASEQLNLSERQVYRLKGGLLQNGIAALAHKNRGRKPPNVLPESLRGRVLRLALTTYRDASLEHMSELLLTHDQISVSPKTIGRILKDAGIRNRHSHKASRRRRSRERAVAEGLLVQMDASPFFWLEDRGPYLHLHGAIDDATGRILGLCFREQEDTLGYFTVLRQIIDRHGVPRSLYTDGRNIFFSPKDQKLSLQDQLEGKTVTLTPFAKVAEKLNIQMIRAQSPQAKGRIERLWGTLQHRLVVEFRVANICSLEEANAFLPTFIEHFNHRFAVPAESPNPLYRDTPDSAFLRRAFCFEYERKADHGSSISFGGQRYQLVDKQGSILPLRPKSTVRVLHHLDGSIEARWGQNYYSLQALTVVVPVTAHAVCTTPHAIPASNHPWRKSYKTLTPRVASSQRNY